MYPPVEPIRDAAFRYVEAGLCVIPLHCGGTKRPRVSWEAYIESPMPWFRLEKHFQSRGRPSGIGVVCGKVSGNLEVLDFDDPTCFDVWRLTVSAQLLDSLPIVRTPSGGTHVLYRCEKIEGNQVLARDQNKKVRIETRGQGGLIVAPGTHPFTHRTRKPYVLLQGDYCAIPTITARERGSLISASKVFNEYVAPSKGDAVFKAFEGEDVEGRGDRPGDDFNLRASWEDILAPHGWSLVKERNGVGYWRKPDGARRDVHATTDHGEGSGFYCFSSSAAPFDAGTGYSKFACYSLLFHEGDFREAASELHRLGFGEAARLHDHIKEMYGLVEE